jgi:hypothetical protein
MRYHLINGLETLLATRKPARITMGVGSTMSSCAVFVVK